MKQRKVSIIIFIFVFQIIFSQHTDIINSNRPSESMSAFAVGKSVIQLESGLNYFNEKHSVLDYKASGPIIDFALRYGIFKEQLEFITDFSFQIDKYTIGDNTVKRSGLRTTTLGFKYLIYDPFKNAKEKINIYSWKANHKFNWKQFIPAVSVYAGTNLNFTNAYNENLDSGSIISPKVMLITQNIFGKSYVLTSNIFMDKISTPRVSYGYILTMTKGINEKWSVFLENKAIQGDFYADGIFSGGAAFLLSDDMQIDASISKNIKNTPALFFGGIGISWRSDTKYKDVVLRDKKEDKKKGKTKKEKEKEKMKKRLDEVEVVKP